MLPTNSITSINFKGIIQIRAFINDYYYTYKRFSIAKFTLNQPLGFNFANPSQSMTTFHSI